MALKLPLLYIPDRLNKALHAGILILDGGSIRDHRGQFVAHLRPANLGTMVREAGAAGYGLLTRPGTKEAIAAGLAILPDGAALKAGQKRAVDARLQELNDAFTDYLLSAQHGTISGQCIDQLLAAMDGGGLFSGRRSVQQASTLLVSEPVARLIADHTRTMARDAGIAIDPEPELEVKSTSRFRWDLEAQRRLIMRAEATEHP